MTLLLMYPSASFRCLWSFPLWGWKVGHHGNLISAVSWNRSYFTIAFSPFDSRTTLTDWVLFFRIDFLSHLAVLFVEVCKLTCLNVDLMLFASSTWWEKYSLRPKLYHLLTITKSTRVPILYLPLVSGHTDPSILCTSHILKNPRGASKVTLAPFSILFAHHIQVFLV